MYTIQALWTAARYKVGVVFVIFNNTSYRILKQRVFAQRGYAAQLDNYVGMELNNPEIDYVGLARSLGVPAEHAATPARRDRPDRKGIGGQRPNADQRGNRARVQITTSGERGTQRMPEQLLPTTVVGSYPQPEWLVDFKVLKSQTVPRVRVKEMWRVAEPFLEQAQDDATLIAIRDMERAGIDIITDGEMRRESYSNRFATALEGIDIDTPAMVKNRAGVDTVVPRVGRQDPTRRAPVEVRDMEFLRRNTDRKAKITLPGPFTMTQQVKNEHYRDQEELAMDFAVAVNAEARDLQTAGADVIQLDEPWLRNDPEGAKRYAIKAINRALEGITVPTVVHLCFGYAFLVKQQADVIFLPVRACGFHSAADLDRGGAAEDRSRRAEGLVGQEDHARRDQSRRPDRGDGPSRSPSASAPG